MIPEIREAFGPRRLQRRFRTVGMFWNIRSASLRATAALKPPQSRRFALAGREPHLHFPEKIERALVKFAAYPRISFHHEMSPAVHLPQIFNGVYMACHTYHTFQAIALAPNPQRRICLLSS